MNPLTPDHLKRIVRQTVLETLEGLGFDAETPTGLQADMHYLRRLRLGAEDMSRRAKGAVLTILISTSLWLLWEAVRRKVWGE